MNFVTYFEKPSKANKECIYTYFIKAIYLKKEKGREGLLNCTSKIDQSNILI